VLQYPNATIDLSRARNPSSGIEPEQRSSCTTAAIAFKVEAEYKALWPEKQPEEDEVPIKFSIFGNSSPKSRTVLFRSSEFDAHLLASDLQRVRGSMWIINEIHPASSSELHSSSMNEKN